MWPPFCLTTSCKRTLAFITTYRHKSSDSARHKFTMWALSCATFSGLLWTNAPPFCLTTSCKRTLAFVTTFRHKSSESAAQLHYVGPELHYIFWPPLDECKGSFARGCEAERWSHWTCSSLGTIFQPMRINSVPDVKCFCNNKNVLHAQSMVWHLVHHPVILLLFSVH